jgi:hypothetical protein
VSYKNQKKSSSLTKIPFSAMTCFRTESEKVTIFVPASVGATNVLNGFPETAVHFAKQFAGGRTRPSPKIFLGLLDFVCPGIFGSTSD